MKRLLLLHILLFAIGFLYAQDSTFVSQYELTGYPWDDNYINGLKAGNVIIKYDGGFALQTTGTLMYPENPLSWHQSPIFNFDREGNFQNVVHGPITEEGAIVDGDFSSVIQDRHGGYLALASYYPFINSLDSLFQFRDLVRIYTLDSLEIEPFELYEDTDGYIITGYQLHKIVCAKCDYNNQFLWSYSYYEHGTNVDCPRMTITSDGGYLFWGRNGEQLEFMKISQSGDSLWTNYIAYSTFDSLPCDLIETNDYYYFAYPFADYVNHQLMLQIRRFQMDSPEMEIMFSMPVVNYIGDSQLNPRFLKLSDGNIILTAALTTGQLNKFDSNMNFLWGSIVFPTQPIVRPMYMGLGNYPTRELPNGDLLTCAYTDSFWLFFIRTNSLGQVTAIEDEVQPISPGKFLCIYPNPFCSTIKISAKRKIPANSEVKIFNIKGQKVHTLKIEDEKIEWKPTHLASGIYFFVLNVEGKRIETHKTIYLKGEK